MRLPETKVSLVLDEGIAFTGDLLPPALVAADEAEAAKESWAKLRELNVRTVYPGHGPTRRMP